MTLAFRLNGHAAETEVPDDDTLLHLLRNRLGLRGTRFGCGTEACGACMVLVDGAPVPSCTTRARDVAGKDVVTIEGLSAGEALGPLQQAFIVEQAGQCGYCLSGIIISATALLTRNKQPTRDEVAAALDGHLCRCGAHNRIIRAVLRAAEAAA